MRLLLLAGALAGQPLPTFPVLTPLPYPVDVSIVANVIDQATDRYDGASFGAVQAADYVTLFDTNWNPYTSGGQATTTVTGGMSPRLKVSGSAVGQGHVSAVGRCTYFFEVRPLGNLQTPTTIPVLLFASAGGSISSGSPYLEGGLSASVRVKGDLVGFLSEDVIDGVPSSYTNSFGGAYPVAASLFSPNAVVLELGAYVDEASPSGNASFDAYVDPVIYVDPNATFEHEGVTLRYVDHFGVAYSPGVEQWQQSIFGDDFEAGGLGGWTATTPPEEAPP